MLELALLTALGIYILFIRMGIRKVLFFGASTDITVSIGLLIALAGTFSGFVLGALSGLILSGLLLITRVFVKPKAPGWLPKRVRGRGLAQK